MKTQFKFIHMVCWLDQEKDRGWIVLTNKDSPLGTITWYSRWQQHVFDPVVGTTYSAGCLTDIAAFIVEANKQVSP